ncbi:hypothetical protein TNCV_2990081 [Trichonephila clavipes]|nr:hypothetical protein TNCV_2990081 [Trichonephila clavipes]
MLISIDRFFMADLQRYRARTHDIPATTGHACSHPRVPRAHQAGFSRRSLVGVGLSESVRCHGPGLALLTNGGVQQRQQHIDCNDVINDFAIIKTQRRTSLYNDNDRNSTKNKDV